MKINKEDIKVTSYLVGIHAFRKDHNYGNYKTNLINDLQSLFNENFESIKVGGMDLLRIGLDTPLEIRLTPSTIIYQDNLEFENIKLNSDAILKLWLKYSPNLKMKLFGLVTNFEINLKRPDKINGYYLKNTYFKDFSIGTKLRGLDLKLNYSVSLKAHEYNVHLNLEEKNEKDYNLIGSIDFNSTTENTISGLNMDSTARTFDMAIQYFENDLFQFLNFEEVNK